MHALMHSKTLNIIHHKCLKRKHQYCVYDLKCPKGRYRKNKSHNVQNMQEYIITYVL